MITPTVGRKVYYSQRADEGQKLGEQPFDATIVFVHDDRQVNLVVRDHLGAQSVRHNVTLLQDDDAPLPGGGHCYWMPYQKAVATGKTPATLHPGQDRKAAAVQSILSILEEARAAIDGRVDMNHPEFEALNQLERAVAGIVQLL